MVTAQLLSASARGWLERPAEPELALKQHVKAAATATPPVDSNSAGSP
jgi:hypothetical protein